MTVPTITSRESITRLALPLIAVFVVSLGYGVVLPVLPFMLAGALGEAERASVAWHTGMLTGVYMLALFLFAPLWGYISDRIGRRTVILIGLAGFSGAMLWFGLARGLVSIYGARALAGVFAVAVLPVVLAWVSDVSTSRTRPRAFAWLSATGALGFMFGSALSGWLASVKIVSQDVALVLPFYAAAMLWRGMACSLSLSSRERIAGHPRQRAGAGYTVLDVAAGIVVAGNARFGKFRGGNGVVGETGAEPAAARDRLDVFRMQPGHDPDANFCARTADSARRQQLAGTCLPRDGYRYCAAALRHGFAGHADWRWADRCGLRYVDPGTNLSDIACGRFCARFGPRQADCRW